MVSGHSYSWALRAHILSVQAIASVLLSAPGVLDQVDTVGIHRTWYDLLNEDIALKDALSTKEVFQVAHILEQKNEKARKFGQTAKLWIQHFDRVITLLRFNRDERTGDWDLHIMSVREMLHTFHAASHLPYATLYLQEIERLEELLPADDFEKYFTIRQTNKFWAGVWIELIYYKLWIQHFIISYGFSTLTIEQVLMKMMKVQEAWQEDVVTANRVAKIIQLVGVGRPKKHAMLCVDTVLVWRVPMPSILTWCRLT